MAYTLGNKCAKNLCKRIVLLQLIIENVVTCFLEQCSFDFDHVTAVDMSFCTSLQNFIQIGPPSAKKE